MGMACGHLIIQPPVVLHFMEGPFMGPSSGQVVEGFRGAEAVAESSVVGEGFVGGSCKELVAWGPSMKLGGSAISKGQLNLPWRLTNDRSPSPVILTNSLQRG
jgi:hypothetical protein